jgi:tetratricopeptide (TPR) repeat protein
MAWAQVGLYSGSDSFSAETWRYVWGRVTTATGEPVRGADVGLISDAGTVQFRSLFTDNEGRFHTDYQFINMNGKEFTVLVTVSKKGYPKAHTYVNFGTSGKPFVIEVVLRPPETDPGLLSPADLVARLTPEFRHLDSSDGLSGRDLKAYDRAVTEFLDRPRLDLAVPAMEKIVASNPSCLRCRIMTSLAELNWNDWRGAEIELGESVNAVINKKLSRPEPLLAYGVWLTWQHQPDKAEPYLEDAVRIAPNDPLALQELGRVQCLTLNWEGAADSLKKALAAGAGPDARLMLAQALVWSGSVKEAEAELNRYVDTSDSKKMAPQVHEIRQRIEERKKDETALVKVQKQAVPYLDYIHNPPPEFQNVEPVNAGVNLELVLNAVGKNIADLYQRFPNTSSLEKIHQEKLDRKGKSEGSLDQRFRYLCLVPAEQGSPRTAEFRGDSTGHETSLRGLKEDFMLTKGFVAAPLLFHPIYQPGTTFRLLGRQKIKGHDSYVIAFAQKVGKSRMYGSFKCNGKSRDTFYQGVAWVDVASYRILQLRTDLLVPLPAVKLEAETTEIQFNAVHFKRLPEDLWLPSDVTVTLDWEGRRLRNRHEYSDFMLFSVDAKEEIGKPKDAAHNSPPVAAPVATQ